MANPEHLDLLQQGVERWNRWYKKHYWEVTPDLRGADLSHMDLSDVRLSFARLEEADFHGSNLQRAYFVQSRLTRSNLSHTNLSEAHLDRAWLLEANLQNASLNAAKIRVARLARANLNEAILSYADLKGTYFNATRLRSTDLSFARLGDNTFVNVDFSTAYGLETVEHTGPRKLVDMRTLLRAHGRTPELFLHGTGFSEHVPTSSHRQEHITTEFPTCLLSYARDDRPFAEQLLHNVRARGIVCHAEPYDSTTGKLITLHDKLLLLLSASSLQWRDQNVLPWILKETRVKASWEAPDWATSGILHLISLDNTLQEKRVALLGSDCRIRWPQSDFSGWQSRENYQEALSCLVKDLHPESGQ